MIASYGVQQRFRLEAGHHCRGTNRFSADVIAVENAKQAFRLLIIYLVITLVITIIGLDAGVYFIVIRPLKVLSDTADRASKGETNQAVLPIKGNDEIATVTASSIECRSAWRRLSRCCSEMAVDPALATIDS